MQVATDLDLPPTGTDGRRTATDCDRQGHLIGQLEHYEYCRKLMRLLFGARTLALVDMGWVRSLTPYVQAGTKILQQFRRQGAEVQTLFLAFGG